MISNSELRRTRVTIPNVTRVNAALGRITCCSELVKYGMLPSSKLSSIGRPVIQVGAVKEGSYAPPLGNRPKEKVKIMRRTSAMKKGGDA
jgi:hypothetical protein